MKKLIPKYQNPSSPITNSRKKVLGPKEYFQDYLYSEGAKRIVNNAYKWMDNYYRNPFNIILHKINNNNKHYGGVDMYKQQINKAKYNLDTSRYFQYSGTPYAQPGLRRVFSNPNYHDASHYGVFRKFDDNYVDAHEYGHVFTWDLPVTRPAINLFNSVTPYLPDNEHDNRFEEKWADLEALRYQLYKYGIYDSRSNTDITPEQVQKMRESYENKDPNIFDRMLESEPDNNKIAEMLNNIVSKPKKEIHNII